MALENCKATEKEYIFLMLYFGGLENNHKKKNGKQSIMFLCWGLFLAECRCLEKTPYV